MWRLFTKHLEVKEQGGFPCLELTKHKVVRPKDLAEGARADRVHGARLQVHQHGSGNVISSCGLIVVHVDSLQLQITVPVVCARGVDAMLITDHLPKLGPDLVAALASLQVHDLPHGGGADGGRGGGADVGAAAAASATAEEEEEEEGEKKKSQAESATTTAGTAGPG